MLSSFDHAERPRRFATVSVDGRLGVWDTATSTVSHSFPRPTHLAVRWTCIAWQAATEPSSDGLLALGSDSGVVVVWDIARGEIVHELRGHTQAVNDVKFLSSDAGAQLLSCGDDRVVFCWSMRTGEQVEAHKTGKSAVHCIAVTASSSHALLGSSMIKMVRGALVH